MDLVLYYRERRNLSCQPYVDRRADADCRKADIRAEATEADRRQAHGSDGTTIVKLLQTDPLPLVSVQINGGPAVTFFIDTGGSTVALDADFAKELGVPQLGTVKGTFAGGQTAEVGLGRIFHQTWAVDRPGLAGRNPPVGSTRSRRGMPNRRHHWHDALLPLPRDDGLSKWSTGTSAEKRAKAAAVYASFERQRRGSVLDCWRPPHGRLGAGGSACHVLNVEQPWEAYLVRYIDDFVVCSQYSEDALRLEDAPRNWLEVRPPLEPTKTKLVEFGRFAQRHVGKHGRKRPETIYFLGCHLKVTACR